MTVYTGPGFEMAVKQFELIANYLGDTRRRETPPADARSDLSRCRAQFTVTAQRRFLKALGCSTLHLALLKGHQIRANRRPWRSCSARDLDELEVCPGRIAIWRRQGRN